MAQAAVESAVSGGLLIGRLAEVPRMKRKTPSELRGEQLKRRTSEKIAVDQLFPSTAFDRPSNGLRNPEQQKISKYISTRVTEVFPVKKSRNIGKENCKDTLQNNEKAPKSADALTTSHFVSSSRSRGHDDSAKLDSSVPSPEEAAKPGFRKAEKCSENALRSVSELHVGDKKQAGSNKLDMERVMKGFGARDAYGASKLNAPNIQVGDVPSKFSDVCCSKITIPGKRAPLDLTLKTTLQFVSSSSVKWCHNLRTSLCRDSIAGLIAQSYYHGRSQNSRCSRPESTKEFLFSRALQSWVHPQSLLPASIISAMVSSTARGESEFILKRYQDWEDSFQNLYYMLRKNLLDIFYVYTTQFIALFIRGNCLDKKQSCNAYLSQSTRGIRSLLRKHGVCFSMPLCNAEVEQATDDDLVELSEIQRLNLGQTLHIDVSDVDNTTQSLLSFIGNKSVHGLFDFLLNYKSFLNSLSAADVPVLYSPVPFQNGCLHIPEVICREMRKADIGLNLSSGFDAEEPGSAFPPSAGNICYSMEIKDVVLPPWVVSGICAAMSSDTGSFDLIIATEPLSMGLNAAFNSMGANAQSKTTSEVTSGGCCEPLGIPDAVLVPSLHSAPLCRLSYKDGEYVAHNRLSLF